MDGLKYFRVMENALSVIPVTISRTGYTGDLGYEIWMQASEALHVWDALMAAGHDFGITPAGILAMDMARVEAGLFMIEVDYTSTNHAWIEAQKSSPYELGLDWAVALDKMGYFVGRRALERERRDGSAWRLMGLEVEWPGMERLFADVGLPPQLPGMAVRGSLPFFSGAVQVGYASTATWSPLLKKYIALGHLQRPHFEPGARLRLEVTVEHKRQHALAKVVRLPFYDPDWKNVGPVFGLPTSTDPLLGPGKWSAGPTAVVLKQFGGWAIGGLANHLCRTPTRAIWTVTTSARRSSSRSSPTRRRKP